MDFVIDFLVGNYMWFLVITIILIFSLIGYIVDSREQKEVSIFDSPQELAKNLEMLAASAQNRTIGDAMNHSNSEFQGNASPVSNTIVPNATVAMNQNIPNQMPSGNMNLNQPNHSNMIQPMNIGGTNSNSSFEVLGK